MTALQRIGRNAFLGGSAWISLWFVEYSSFIGWVNHQAEQYHANSEKGVFFCWLQDPSIFGKIRSYVSERKAVISR